LTGPVGSAGVANEGWPRPEVLTDQGWWQQERLEYLRDALTDLPSRSGAVLDAGCGTGFAIRTLVSGTGRVALDAYEYDEWADRSEVHFVKGDMAAMPFGPDTFDLVMSLDAIEHYRDDRAALREVVRVCHPTGHVLIAVPALKGLWSGYDEHVGHFRRYDRRSLAAACADVGLDPIRMTYIFGWLTPLAWVLRRSSLRTHNAAEPGAISAIAHALSAAERAAPRWARLPLGTSLLALCRVQT
jgi:SAM-dependent methyltransferase